MVNGLLDSLDQATKLIGVDYPYSADGFKTELVWIPPTRKALERDGVRLRLTCAGQASSTAHAAG